MAEPGKVCSKCKEWKPLSEFYKDRTRIGGHRSRCKVCVKEYRRSYYEANRGEITAQRRAYHEANRERANALQKAWREANPGRRRAHYEANREVELAQGKAWKAANPDKVREGNARRRALKVGAGGGHTAAEFRALCELFGWVCLCCGVSHEDSPLTEDHVVPLSKGGSDSAENLQPVCLSCNLSKGTKTIDYRGASACSG